MALHGLSVKSDWEQSGNLTERGGYAVAEHLLQGKARPTAIIAGNDLMAIGAMRAAREVGLVVGRDLSVIGFDDITLAEHAHPPLTTVRQPIYEIGRQVCRMLVQTLMGRPLEEGGCQVLFEPELVIRESTGPPTG
jgi:LacI family transcriptional regulator